MRKRMIALCAVGMIGMAGVIAGGAAVHSASDPTLLAVAGDGAAASTGPLRLLFSGQAGKLMKLKSDLHLTAEQRSQIQQIIKSHRGEIAGVVRPIVEKHRLLRDAISAPEPDEHAIRTAAANLGDSIGDAAVLASKVRAEVAPILTADQKQTIAAFRADRQSAVDNLLDTWAAKGV